MGYQVFDITHDSSGSPLPANKKPFISFSYGGKNIEDFNLIVTFMDRYNRNIYSNIKNTTTTYQGVHGQMFWEYSYEANLYTFTLSTDGMTYEELEDFKNYFVPGVYKDLILAETSNRKALARISTTPQMNMLPFEEKKVFKVDNEEIEISTTLFKGDVSIEFCLDYPFWSAINSYYDSVTEDNAKNIFEDKIPTKEMLKTNMFLGNNKYYNGTDIVDDFSVAATKDTPIYLYYCGTSKGHPEITMTIQPTIGEDGFISEPGNSYTKQYPYLEIDGNKFYYTTPNLLTSYNKAIEIVSKYNSGDSIIELRKELRDNINHLRARAWGIAILDSFREDINHTYCTADGALVDGFKDNFVNLMEIFIKDNDENTQDLIVKIDASKYITTVRFKCRNATSNFLTVEEAKAMPIVDIEENSGDMIRNNYLLLENRNSFNSNGTIGQNECSKLISSIDLKGVKLKYSYEYL